METKDPYPYNPYNPLTKIDGRPEDNIASLLGRIMCRSFRIELEILDWKDFRRIELVDVSPAGFTRIGSRIERRPAVYLALALAQVDALESTQRSRAHESRLRFLLSVLRQHTLLIDGHLPERWPSRQFRPLRHLHRFSRRLQLQHLIAAWFPAHMDEPSRRECLRGWNDEFRYKDPRPEGETDDRGA